MWAVLRLRKYVVRGQYKENSKVMLERSIGYRYEHVGFQPRCNFFLHYFTTDNHQLFY